jgi:pyridoxine 5-phosphate synthase
MPVTQLSVNVNKLATLRNARGKNLPDVVAWSERILQFGAHGITVHPRPDGRHIRFSDVEELSALLTRWNRAESVHAEFNIEGFPSDDFLCMVERVKPEQCTLVPDPPDALTSNAGWLLKEREHELRESLERLRAAGVRSSVFVDPYAMDEAALERLRPDRIELYTERFAECVGHADEADVVAVYRRAAEAARAAGCGVNAGHDLNQRNLGILVQQIPWIAEVSIGHALVCEALADGMETTIRRYLEILEILS